MCRLFWSNYEQYTKPASGGSTNEDTTVEEEEEESEAPKGTNRINFYDRKIKTFRVAPNRISIIGDPYVMVEIEGRSFFRYFDKSFCLKVLPRYQIRKMLGLLLSIHHRNLQDRMLNVALDSPFKVLTPMALSPSLYLDSIEVAPKAAHIIKGLYQDRLVRDDIENFKRAVLYPHIAKYLKPTVRGPKQVEEGH
jgi:hypothetical protein